MINAAIVGLGWWGKVLVNSVQGKSDKIKFTHAQTRTRANAEEFCGEQGIELVDTYEQLLDIPDLDAVVLATPHSKHREQIEAAAAAGKHVFCEKPLTLTKADTEAAIAACDKAGVTLGIGHNRRFNPNVIELGKRIQNGDLGTLLHCESTQTAPNGMFLPATAWRADKTETPAGGMTPMGIHLVDLMIAFLGEVDEVYCQSFRRAVPNDTDDTTSVLLRMKNGMSAYLGTMLATQAAFRFQVYGTKGWVMVDRHDMSHFEFVPGSEKPLGGGATLPDPEHRELDDKNASVGRNLDAFAEAASGGAPYPVPASDIIHATAVLEAIVKSAESHKPEKVG